MKKLLTPLFALAALAMTNTSCSDDLENGASGNSNEATVSFNVQLENAVGSRSVIGDGTQAQYLAFGVYKEANENDSIADEITLLRQDNVKVDAATLTATVTTRLVKGQTYNFIFWAQNEKTDTEGTYYNVKDLRDIKVVYNGDENKEIAANDEKRDAFYAVKKALKVTGPITETITLKRPFAQVNVGTKVGSLAEAIKAETEIAKSSIVISEVATVLHPYSGRVSKKAEVKYSISQIPETSADDGTGDLKNVEINKELNTYEYLSMNYILVNDQNGNSGAIDGTKQALVNATFNIYEKNNDTDPVNTFEIPNVPVQRNWRTNIIGDIMNESVTFNIVIDPKFDNDHNYITNEELYYAAQNGGEVTLKEPLVVNSAEEALVIKKGATVVLNLNGQGIKANVAKVDAIVVEEGAELTINGDESAVIEAISGGNGYAMVVKGKATINGGYYKSGKDEDNATNACVYATGNGQIYVNGGKFESADGTFVLNKKDGDRATTIIEVRGGTFVNFNPADNASEGAGTNFVAEGYKAVNIGTEEAPVYEVCVDVKVAAGQSTALSANGTVLETLEVNGGTLDGQGYTLNVAETPATNILVGGESDVTIKNLTITGDNQTYGEGEEAKSTRALYFTKPGNITIDNVHVSGVGYALNVNAQSGTGTLEVSNSTLMGWTSYAAAFASAKFTNVHFGISKYFEGADNAMFNGGIRPYMTTVFENCTFEKGFFLSLTNLPENATLTFKHCTVNDEVLDAENIHPLLAFQGNTEDERIKF